MSQVRVAVEWVFGDIANDFKFIDIKKNLKTGLSAVGKFYVVCLETVLRACMGIPHQNTSRWFHLTLMSIYSKKDGHL